MAGIETVGTISHNKPAEPAEAQANSNQINGPTYMYQDAIQRKKKWRQLKHQPSGMDPLHHLKEFKLQAFDKQQAWTALTSNTCSHQIAQFNETFQYNTNIIAVLKSLLNW
jgi:hypothetical protein